MSLENNIGSLYIFYSSVVGLEFILGLILNLTVIHSFIFKLKFWKSKTINIFLFNLVLADILLLIGLPVKAYNFQQLSENKVVCKVQLFLQFLSRGASITFLTIVYIYRYSTMLTQNRIVQRILERSPQISVFIWMILGILTIPAMMQSFINCKSNENEFAGDRTTEVILREIVFFTQIFIPFFVLVYCLIRTIISLKQKSVGDKMKLKKAKLLVTMVLRILAFAICFLPSAFTRAVNLQLIWDLMPDDKRFVGKLYDGFICLSYLNCLLNPILYCLSGTKFKKLYMSTYFRCLVKNQSTETSVVSL